MKLKKVVIQIPKAETKTKSRDKSEATQLIMSTEKSPFSPVAMRSVAWFYQRLGKPVSVTHADMQSVYGDAAQDMSTVWRWYQLHAGDNIDLGTNRGLAGQETKVLVSVWSVFSMMNHIQPYGKLLWLLERQSRQFGGVLHRCQFQCFNLGWVPHDLSVAQKQARVAKACELLESLNRTGPSQVLTSDASWFSYHTSPRTKWARTRAEAGQRPRQTTTKEKAMVVVFWSCSGFFFVTAVPDGKTYTSEYVIDVLVPELEKEIRKRRPCRGLRGIKLHWDNARPHITTRTRDFLTDKGVHLLPQPPYSLDIVPSEFYLFGHLKTQICGIEFKNSSGIVEKVREIMSSFCKDELHRVYEEWKRRLVWVSSNNGEYCP